MKTGVIGAGIGGLTAACLLAADGNEVVLWEKNATVGGKMNQQEMEGFRFDTGPSLLTMPEIITDIFKACGRNISDYLHIVPINPVCRYYWKDGTMFDCSTNLPDTLRQIKTFAPEDVEAYVDFLGYSADIYRKTAQTFLFNPLQQLRDLKNVRKSDIFKINALATVSSKVDKYVESAYLRQFFKRFTTYNGSSPFIAPATLNVIPYVELCLGGFYVKGGLYQIAKALEKLALELGVELKMNTCIDKIITTGETATKVRTQAGELFEVDAVFSNSDATHTYTRLLSKEVVNRRSRRHYNSIEPSCSGFVLMLGTSKTFETLIHHTIFFSDDYESEFRDIFIKKRPSPKPTIYVANTSHYESGHAPEGCSNLFILVNTPYLTEQVTWTDSFVEEYGSLIIEQLENAGLAGLKESIVVREHITPQDFYDIYLSNKGSIYGTSSNLPTAAFMRPRNKSPYLNNLYMTGGSTHPGGGIPLVMLSARHAVKLFKRDQK